MSGRGVDLILEWQINKGSTFDISLNRLKSGVEVKVTDSAGKVLYKEAKKDGEAHSISLPR